MEFEQIITLIHEVSASNLTRFCLQEEGFSLSMKTDKQTKAPIYLEKRAEKEECLRTADSFERQEMPKAETVETKKSGSAVTSPLVGTFYRSASPESEPYVKVGDHVTKGQVLAIVEAMKLMNEIESEFTGTVKEVLAENESMVEYGQTLFIIEEEES